MARSLFQVFTFIIMDLDKTTVLSSSVMLQQWKEQKGSRSQIKWKIYQH